MSQYRLFETPYKLAGFSVTVLTRPDNSGAREVVYDVRVKLTRAQYQLLLTRLPDPHATAQNAPYLYLFQNGLNRYNEYAALRLRELKTKHQQKARQKYLQEAKKIQQMKHLMHQLRVFTKPFATLEAWVNDQGYDPKATLTRFQAVFGQFVDELDKSQANLLTTYQENAEIKHLIENRLFPRLKADIQAFSLQLEKLKQEQSLSSQQIRHVLSINRRDPSLLPLGQFIGESLIHTLDMGLKAAKEIHGSRLMEQISGVNGPSELTHAKLALEIKLSTQGTGYVDTFSKTDKALIEQYMLSPQHARPGLDEVIEVSLAPYCADLQSSDFIRVLEVLATLPSSALGDGELGESASLGTPGLSSEIHGVTSPELCKMAPDERERERFLLSSIAIGFWVLSVGAIEAVAAIAHFGLNLALLIPAFVFPHTIERLDAWISAKHEQFSRAMGLKRAKKSWNERYIIGQEESLQQMIQQCMDPRSYFQEVLAHDLSVKAITSLLKTSYVSIVNNLLVTPYRLIRYAFIEKTPKETFDDVNRTYDNEKKQYVKCLEELATLIETNTPGVVKSRVLNQINALQIPTSFATEIIVGGANLLVTPVFRNAPGVSTTFFAFAIGGFVCYLPPIAAISLLKGLVKALTMPLDKLSIQLMGSLPTTLMNQAVSGLFLWKIGVLSTEAMVSLYKGHYEFLETLIENPEKLIMGLTGVLALGYGLRFLPAIPLMITLPGGVKIPNLYALIINIYIEQAKEGSLEANLASIDYILLGLQTAVLLQTLAMIDKREYPVVSLLKAFEDKKILSLEEQAIEPALQEIFSAHAMVLNSEMTTQFIEKIKGIKTAPVSSNDSPSINPRFRTWSKDAFQVAERQPNTVLGTEDSNRQEIAKLYDEIVSACDRLEHGLGFEDKIESSARNQAMRYYEHMSAMFHRYNELACLIGDDIPLIDERPFLAVFYRRFCTSTHTMIGRLVSIFPLGPITYFARILSAAYGFWGHRKPWFRDAAIATSDDILMFTEFIFATVRAIWAFFLYVSAVFRMPLALLVLPLKISELFYAKEIVQDVAVFNDDYECKEKAPPKETRTWLDKVYGVANSISLHRTYEASKRLPVIGPFVRYVGGFLSSIHTNAARSVSTHDDIVGAARALRTHLQEVAEKRSRPSSYGKIMQVRGDTSTTHASNLTPPEAPKHNEQPQVQPSLKEAPSPPCSNCLALG